LSVLISFVVMMKVGKLSREDLGLTSSGVFGAIARGLIGGFIAITLTTLAIKLLGGVTIEYVFKPEYLSTLLLGVVFFAFQGTYEELIYRSYLMPHLSKKLGDIGGILLSSVLFVLLHAMNPGITVVPVINLFLASIVFSLIYYLTGNLWLVGVAHGIWNYAQGFFYGSLVSGNALSETVFKSLPVEGKDLISGGSFGFEGGIITSLLGLIVIGLTFAAIKKQRNKAQPLVAA
ncbi:CPBP family intramembrane glutamic endopeptidase, partial [Stomatohabitans albus]